MQNRKCSKCGSANVYKNVDNNWHQDGIVIQTIVGDSFNDLFPKPGYPGFGNNHHTRKTKDTG